MRNRTGLRNRHRNGRGSYSRKNKAALSDRYATYNQGIPNGTMESINGRNSFAATAREKP